MPPLAFVLPVCALTPVIERVPAPVFVRLPFVAALAPETVSRPTGLLTLMVPVVPVEIVKLRSVLPVAPVKSSVDPFRTRFAAAFEDAPRLLAKPPFAILPTASVPALMAVAPP